MATKFSQFNNVGTALPGDIIVGLRSGINTQFTAAAFYNLGWNTELLGAPLLINNGYFMANGAPASFSLPTVATAGQIIPIINVSGVGFTITQAAGQQITIGNDQTTLGVGGSLASVALGDSLTLVCYAANTSFFVLGAPQGVWVVT